MSCGRGKYIAAPANAAGKCSLRLFTHTHQSSQGWRNSHCASLSQKRQAGEELKSWQPPGVRRVKLPEVLPPSFKGMSTRYAYVLQATAHFKAPHAGPGLPRAPAGPAVPSAGVSEPAVNGEAPPSPTASEQSLASAAGGARGGAHPPGRAVLANGQPGGAQPRWGWGFGSYSANLPVAAAAAAAAGAAEGEARPAGGATAAAAGGPGWREAAARVPVHLWPPWVRPTALMVLGSGWGLCAACVRLKLPEQY